MQAQTLTIGNQTFALAEPESAHIAAVGKTATERKFGALTIAKGVSEAAVVAISHGSGKVAKAAAEIKKQAEVGRVVEAFARGDLQGFAALISARTGESVRFAKRTDAEGNVLKSAWESVRDYGAVLENKLLQLQDKGKEFNAKGGYTSAAADLHYLIALHGAVLRRKVEIEAANAERLAQIKAERELALQAEKGADSE